MKNVFRKNKTTEAQLDTSSPMLTGLPKKHVRRLKGISSTLILIVSAPLLALIITSHVFHSYEVDGLSMAATLQNGDRLIVYKLPKTLSNLKGSSYLPKRGDIVVFDKPKQLSGSSNVEHLIKRVIALPGERITIQNGEVTVYGANALDGFDPDKNTDYSDTISKTSGNVDITVGQGEIFVMGDNRSNSTDSRIFGSISTDNVVGTAEARFLPTSSMRKF